MSIYSNSGGSGPHLAIETWLTALGVMEYQQLFAKYGGVEVSNSNPGYKVLRIYLESSIC